jgi:hypothetical protein
MINTIHQVVHLKYAGLQAHEIHVVGQGRFVRHKVLLNLVFKHRRQTTRIVRQANLGALQGRIVIIIGCLVIEA